MNMDVRGAINKGFCLCDNCSDKSGKSRTIHLFDPVQRTTMLAILEVVGIKYQENGDLINARPKRSEMKIQRTPVKTSSYLLLVGENGGVYLSDDGVLHIDITDIKGKELKKTIIHLLPDARIVAK